MAKATGLWLFSRSQAVSVRCEGCLCERGKGGSKILNAFTPAPFEWQRKSNGTVLALLQVLAQALSARCAGCLYEGGEGAQGGERARSYTHPGGTPGRLNGKGNGTGSSPRGRCDNAVRRLSVRAGCGRVCGQLAGQFWRLPGAANLLFFHFYRLEPKRGAYVSPRWDQ